MLANAIMPTADTITLRTCRDTDAGPVAAIYAHYVANSVATFDFEAPSADAWSDRIGTIASRGHPFLVAETGGQIAGFAYATDYRVRPGYRFTCEDTVYLAPDHCGRGYGTEMLSEVIARARACGFRQMLAVIALTGATPEPSVRLHEKLGFQTIGTFARIGHKLGRWIDVVHMQRAL